MNRIYDGKVIQSILGEDYDGIVSSDFYGGYNRSIPLAWRVVFAANGGAAGAMEEDLA